MQLSQPNSLPKDHSLAKRPPLNWQKVRQVLEAQQQVSSEDQGQDIQDYPVHFSPAEQYISMFATETFWLMVFIENIILRNPKENLQPIMYNTLLETYLDHVSFTDALVLMFFSFIWMILKKNHNHHTSIPTNL